jgi:hypothetical protein
MADDEQNKPVKPPKYILDYRSAMSREFGVTESMIDDWANQGLEILKEMRNSKNQAHKELHDVMARAFLPAYFAGVQCYVMFKRTGKSTA